MKPFMDSTGVMLSNSFLLRCPGVDPKGPCCRLHAKSQAKQAPKVVSKEAGMRVPRFPKYPKMEPPKDGSTTTLGNLVDCEGVPSVGSFRWSGSGIRTKDREFRLEVLGVFSGKKEFSRIPG